MDVSRYARFERPGHAVTGDRSQRGRGWMKPETRVGYDYAHAIVDDHSRLAYVELHNDEKAVTVTGFLERALAFFAEHGIAAKRLMTDNAFSYVKNRSLRELLARHGRWYVHDRDPVWLRRNALVVLGNVGSPSDERVDAAIARAVRDAHPIVRAHAVWAAGRLGLSALVPSTDDEAIVRDEIDASTPMRADLAPVPVTVLARR